MRQEADIFDRVYEYGMQRARLEAIRDSLQAEVHPLRAENKKLLSEIANSLSTIRFLETKNSEMVTEKGMLQRELDTVMSHYRMTNDENAKLKSYATIDEAKALSALKVIASGGASKIGMKRYAAETLQKIRKGE